MSMLDIRLCPGCGNLWHGYDDDDEDTGECPECGYECERPPTVREMLEEAVTDDWSDLAAFARGVAGVVLDNPDEVRRLLGMGNE